MTQVLKETMRNQVTPNSLPQRSASPKLGWSQRLGMPLRLTLNVSTLHLASNEHYTQDISVSILPFLVRYNTCKENFTQLGQLWPKR
jgi:hypothetical protein